MSIFETNSVKAGHVLKGWLETDESYFGFKTQFPYIRLKGKTPGPRAVILSGIHGDELNGIQIIHGLADLLDPAQMSGDLILLPVANVPGFFIQSRYLPDRRDLNRMFPGDKEGSEGSRLADFLWDKFVKGADFGIDLHSASYNRWNFPHVRGNMRLARIRELASAFGSAIVMHSQGVSGSLRREATRAGVPFLLFEAGQINRFEKEVLHIGLEGIWNVLERAEMIHYRPEILRENTYTAVNYYRKNYWIRAGRGGFLLAEANPGDTVEQGDVLGVIVSALGDKIEEIKSPTAGRILGFHLHPQVVPGRALYHICHDLNDL